MDKYGLSEYVQVREAYDYRTHRVRIRANLQGGGGQAPHQPVRLQGHDLPCRSRTSVSILMNQTNEIFTRLPNASAYHVKVRPEGILPRIKLLSSLDDLVELDKFCVGILPFLTEVWIFQRFVQHVTPSLSRLHFSTPSCETEQSPVPFAVFLGLINKRVQRNDLFVDLSAIKSSTYPFFPSGSQLKKTITHRLCKFIRNDSSPGFPFFKSAKVHARMPFGKWLLPTNAPITSTFVWVGP